MNITSLQHFADNPTVNVTTDSTLSAENKTFYDRALVEEAGPNLIHGQFGQKRPIPKNGGKRIQFRRYASLPKALKPLTEGVTPEGRKLSATAVEAEVNQYGDFVCLSDVLDLTAIDNNVLEATKAVGRQAGLTLDTITRNVLQSGTNVFYCPKVGANGVQTPVTDRSGLDKTCTLTVDVVKKVAAMLKAANAPKIDGDYVCILHPYVAYDIMSDPRWEEMHKYTTPENYVSGGDRPDRRCALCGNLRGGGLQGHGKQLPHGPCRVRLPVYCPGRLRCDRGHRRRTADHHQAAGLCGHGRPSRPAQHRGLEGIADGGDSDGSRTWYRVECCSAFSPTAEAN